MSRTFLIANGDDTTALFSSTTHEQQTAVARAMGEAGYDPANDHPLNSFYFNLTDVVRNLQVQRLKDDVLSRLQFSCDGYISGALSRMVTAFYRNTEGKQYSEFLNSLHLGSDAENTLMEHIEAFGLGEETMLEAGMPIVPQIPRLHHLLQLREVLHSISAGQLSDPSRYSEPTKADGKIGFKPGKGTEDEMLHFLGSPRMRNLSVQSEEALRDVAADDTDDVELREELFEQYKLSDKYERMNQLRMDQMKASALIALWHTLKLGDVTAYQANTGEPIDAFDMLDGRTQLGMLRTAHKAVHDCRMRAVIDNRVPVMEKAKLRVEAKALIPLLQKQMDHPKFDDELTS